MALPNIFSRRNRAARGVETDVYSYDEMGRGVRVQFCQIISDAIGPYAESDYSATPGVRVYKELARFMRKELAVFILPPATSEYTPANKEFFDWFLNERDNERVLDGVELACRALEAVVEPDTYNFRDYVRTSVQGAIAELNARFLESGYGYQYVAGQISQENLRRGVLGETSVVVEVADNSLTREKGLSGRTELPRDQILYFIFSENDFHGIWMKEMYFSIDIIWLNEYSEVIHVERNITPETFPKTFGPQKPSKYVLEFNAGFAAKNGIKIGDKFVRL
jgi:uncharacterized membrane protein (UPF0127 family)